MGVFGNTISIIWPVLLVAALIAGLIWLITAGPLGDLFKSLFESIESITSTISTMQNAVNNPASVIPGMGGGNTPWHVPGTSVGGTGGDVLRVMSGGLFG